MHKENIKENKKIKVKFVLDKSSGLYNSVIIKPENKEERWQKTFLDKGTELLGIDCSAMIYIVSDLIAETEARVREEIIENK